MAFKAKKMIIFPLAQDSHRLLATIARGYVRLLTFSGLWHQFNLRLQITLHFIGFSLNLGRLFLELLIEAWFLSASGEQ